MSQSLKKLLIRKTDISIILLIIVYTVGFVSIFAGYTDQLMRLTPFNLLFVALLILLNARGINTRYLIAFAIVGVSGYLIEWAGVATGIIFGSYKYGNGLGFKLNEVPLLIGLNWAMLVFSILAVLSDWKRHQWIVPFAGASIMVMYDILLEPVAIRFDFWQWENVLVPLQNYVAWWLISLVMMTGVQHFVSNRKNPIAGWVLAIQSLFFIALKISEKLQVF